MVFQSYALYPHMTVAKNIESPLVARKITVDGEAEPRKLDKHERDERVAEAAGILGLTELLDRKPAPSPAASASGSPWPGPSSADPRCSSWTSRCRTSTPSCGPRPASSSSTCTAGSAPRSSTSPTTRSRP